MSSLTRNSFSIEFFFKFYARVVNISNIDYRIKSAAISIIYVKLLLEES